MRVAGANKEEVNHEREALLRLFTSLLRPLMPVALARGISAREISDSVRRAYVQVLESSLQSQERQLSDARLALVAGLTRSEVRLFRGQQQTSNQHVEQASQFDPATVVLSVWHTHPKFSGAYGLAFDLDLDPAADSSGRTFADLVEAACPGADRDAILDQLIAIDSVEVIERKSVRCKSRAGMFSKSDDVTVERIDRAAKCLQAAAESFAHNLQREASDEFYFERMVISNHPLTASSRDEFAKVAEARGHDYVMELDTWLTKHTEPDVSPKGKRYGVGVYFFEEAQPEQLHDAGASGGASIASLEMAGKQGPAGDDVDALASLGSVRLETTNPGE